jgi:hypothetical protein
MRDKNTPLLDNDHSSDSIIILSTSNIRSLYMIKLLSDGGFKTSHSISIVLSGLMILLAGIFFLPALIMDYYGEYLGGYFFGLSAIFLFYSSYTEFDLLKKSVNNNNVICDKLLESRNETGLVTSCKQQLFQHSAFGLICYLNIIASIFMFFGGISFIPQTGAINWFGYPLASTSCLILIFNQVCKLLYSCVGKNSNFYESLQISKSERSLVEKNLKSQFDDLNKIKILQCKDYVVEEILYGLSYIFNLISFYTMRDATEEELIYCTYCYIIGGVLCIISGVLIYYKYLEAEKNEDIQDYKLI